MDRWKLSSTDHKARAFQDRVAVTREGEESRRSENDCLRKEEEEDDSDPPDLSSEFENTGVLVLPRKPAPTAQICRSRFGCEKPARTFAALA